MNIRYKFLLNLIFALYHSVIGLISDSWWFVAIGAYYIVLSIVRVMLIRFSFDKRKNENRIMRFCSIMIFLLAVVLCGIVYMTLNEDVAVKYHEIVMISMALYAFIKLTLAVIGFVKSRKHNKYTEKALQSIAVVDATVSIYSLQRSMLVSFGAMAKSDINIFNACTGIGVCIIIILIGIGDLKMAKSKIVKVNKKIENAVVGGYKKIENGVVNVYTKIEDKFVDMYLTKDGETVEEAKKRLKNQ